MHKRLMVVVAVLTMAVVCPLPAHPTPQQPSQSFWQRLLQQLWGGEPIDRGRGGFGGGRPVNGSCLISPDASPIWHNRPLFVWQGDSTTIGVRLPGSESVLWRQTATPGATSNLRILQYDGPTLQPGQTYDWLFFVDRSSRKPAFWPSFQVMSARDRLAITADLRRLEATLQRQNATPEAIAFQRSQYFIQRRLWADAIQEIYAVKNPSPDLQQLTQEIEKKVCQSQK